MSHERLAELIQACQVAMEADETQRVTHAAILSLLTALEKHEITEGQDPPHLGLASSPLGLTRPPTPRSITRQQQTSGTCELEEH